jgi:AcrR family transcriptional regulator
MNQHSKSEVRSGTQLRDKVRGLVRDELLQAAEGVFAEEGLQTAKVESIAARAGVSVGTVYNYFSDRKALVDAVMESRKEDLFLRLQQLEVQTIGRPFLERLEVSLETVLAYFQSQRPYFLLMLQAEGAPVFKQALLTAHDPCKGPFGSIFEHLEKLMSQGIAEGALREEDPKLLAMFLAAISRGVSQSALADPRGPDDIGHRRSVILRFFLNGASPTGSTAKLRAL